MKGIVYKYTFPDGKVYIGKTKREGKRILEHFDKTSGPSNPGFHEALKDVGKPKYEVLYEKDFSNPWELEVTLCRIEELYINQYHATDPEFGYNKIRRSSLSPGILKKLDETIFNVTNDLIKEKIDICDTIINKLYRTKEKLTQEEFFFLKEKYKDRNPFQYLINEFNFDDYSLNSDFDLELMIDDAVHSIKDIIRMETETDVAHYVYNHAGDILKMQNDKSILKISLEGEVLKEYYSINDVCEELKIVRPDNIRNVLRGKQKTAYGFIWKYKKDYNLNHNN